MSIDTNFIGWLHILDEAKFGQELQTVLSPARAIQSAEYLRGRTDQLDGIRQAWYQPGRQIFIHGFRGVGKTSLAQTAAFQRQPSSADPILLACSEDDTFFTIIRDMLEQALPSDPTEIRRVTDQKGSVRFTGLSYEVREAIERGHTPIPTTLNEAVRFAQFLDVLRGSEQVVIIDEFDLMRKGDDHIRFANFVKQIADQKVMTKFIFCGIGDSLDDLFKAHASAHRYFHPVKLDRLGWEARLEIIEVAAAHLGVEVDRTTAYRIARISDGFPHYVHLVCEKLFWRVFEKRNDGKVTPDLFEESLHVASEALETHLKLAYEAATRKYTNDYEPILWATADNHELERRSRDIYASYERIMKATGQEPLERTQFNSRMNNLKKKQYGKILTGTRQGWYQYTEKMVRGYARLRAELGGVELEKEHPMQNSRV